MIALSFSRLNDFDTCPRKFKLKYLDKTFPDDSNNPVFVKGNEIHAQMKAYADWLDKGGKKPYMNEHSKNGMTILSKVFNAFSSVMTERQFAIGMNHKQCEWFSRQAYYRAIVDVLALNAREGLIIDHKSGKIRDYSDKPTGQLRLNAWMIFHINPDIERLTSAYLFLEHKQYQKRVYERDELEDMDKAFRDKFDEVNQEKEFAPKRNYSCRWCPATKTQCPFGGN